MVGFSDTATLITPLTLMSGWATLHGHNLLDTPYRIPDGLLGWLDVVRLEPGASFRQRSPRAYREGFVDDADDPQVDTYALDRPGGWWLLDGEDDVEVTGRLIGGCLETLAPLAGTPYLEPSWLADRGDGLIVYLEVGAAGAFEVCRTLHGLRLTGVLERADAVLVGRTEGADAETMTQDESSIVQALA